MAVNMTPALSSEPMSTVTPGLSSEPMSIVQPSETVTPVKPAESNQKADEAMTILNVRDPVVTELTTRLQEDYLRKAVKHEAKEAFLTVQDEVVTEVTKHLQEDFLRKAACKLTCTAMEDVPWWAQTKVEEEEALEESGPSLPQLLFEAAFPYDSWEAAMSEPTAQLTDEQRCAERARRRRADALRQTEGYQA